MRRGAAAGRNGGLVAGLTVAGLLLAGCVNMPSGGSLSQTSLPNSDGSQQSQIVVTPRGPSPQWQPEDIVRGFLVASGANLSDESIARKYLTGYYGSHWRPSATPRVIDTGSTVTQTNVPFNVTGNRSSAQVTVSSPHLETLVAAGPNEAGRLQVYPEPGPYKYTFDLVQGNGGKWRIDSIDGPSGKPDLSLLLITDADFQRDYLPRNLYYLASGSDTLVPYPVYIPGQELLQTGVQQLVDAVRSLPPTNSNWLYHAITTAFPPGTKISAQVHSNQAVITLGGAAARTDTATLGQMEAQLVWTLTYAPDAAGTGIGSVELHVGRISEFLVKRRFTSAVQQGPSGPLYYQTLDRTGRPLLEQFSPGNDFGATNVGRTGGATRNNSAAGGVRTTLVLPAHLGRGAFTAIAISPAPFGGANTFAGCRGRKVYVAPLLVNSDLQEGTLPADCTSMTWDAQGDLWVAAGTDVYVVNETVTGISLVTIPASQIPGSDTYVSLKVAPDGVRVAMIVRGKSGASVIVSSITKKPNSDLIYLAQGVQVLTVGPDLVDPTALCWWDSDHLLVIDHRHGVPQLYKVPLDGGESTKVPTPADVTSVTANGSFAAVSTSASGGRGQPTVLASQDLKGIWVQVDVGRTPAYVGLAAGVRLTPSRSAVSPRPPNLTPRRSFRRYVM